MQWDDCNDDRLNEDLSQTGRQSRYQRSEKEQKVMRSLNGPFGLKGP